MAKSNGNGKTQQKDKPSVEILKPTRSLATAKRTGLKGINHWMEFMRDMVLDRLDGNCESKDLGNVNSVFRQMVVAKKFQMQHGVIRNGKKADVLLIEG